MSRWMARVEELQADLDRLNECLKTNSYSQLPESIQTMIARGVISTEDKIEKYKHFAEIYKEKPAAEA